MKKKKPLFIFLSTVCCVIYAQQAPKEKKLTDAEQNQMEKAQLMVEEKNYRLALPIFEKLIARHPSDPSLKYFTALCYLVRPDKHPLALQYLTEVYEVNKKADEIELDLAKANFFNGRFNEAEDFLNLYSSKLKKQNADQKREINSLGNYIKNARILTASPVTAKISNLGNVVNTASSENSPFVTMDDALLIYTYRGDKSTGGKQNAFNEPDASGLFYEDVYMSVKENGAWATPQGIKAVNSNTNDEALCISYDGQKLFISRDTIGDDGDIWVSELKGNTWAMPKRLAGGVNTSHWEDNCTLSADGKILFFSSSRPGGYGGKDIYRCRLMPDSTWGPAENLGEKINTLEDEDDPFFHPDGRLLLFSSKGHNSMGGYDVFKTYFNPVDSSWTAPENMGFPINTVDDDYHYVLSPSGDKAYYSQSNPQGYGDNDLYTVEPGITGIMPAMLVVKGNVSLDDKPAKATIDVLQNNVPYKKINSSENGIYQVVLPLGANYKISWKLDSFPEKTLDVDVQTSTGYVLKTNDVSFKSKKDSVIVIENVGGSGMVEGLVFRIQVAAECMHWNTNREKLKEFGNVERKVVNNIPRFTLDREYKTLEEVKVALNKIRNGVVPDAFIICTYKGERRYVSELRKMGVIPEKKLLPGFQQ